MACQINIIFVLSSAFLFVSIANANDAAFGRIITFDDFEDFQVSFFTILRFNDNKLYSKSLAGKHE